MHRKRYDRYHRMSGHKAQGLVPELDESTVLRWPTRAPPAQHAGATKKVHNISITLRQQRNIQRQAKSL